MGFAFTFNITNYILLTLINAIKYTNRMILQKICAGPLEFFKIANKKVPCGPYRAISF